MENFKRITPLQLKRQIEKNHCHVEHQTVGWSIQLQKNKTLLGWADYAANFSFAFKDLLRNEKLVDVTLVADGHFFKAHRLVLSALSPFFQKMFNQMSANQEAFVVLKDVSKQTAEDSIKFIYNGEVKIELKNLNDFLNVANTLDMKGLTDINHPQQSGSFDPSQSRSSFSLDGMQHQSTHSNHHLASTSSLNEIHSEPTCSNALNEFQTLIDEFEGDECIYYEDTYKANDFDHSIATNNPEMACQEVINDEHLNKNHQKDPEDDQEIDFVSVLAPKRAKRNNDYADYNIVANVKKKQDGRKNIFYNNYKFYRSTLGNIRQRWTCTYNKAKKCRASISTVKIDGITMMKVLNGEHTHEMTAG